MYTSVRAKEQHYYYFIAVISRVDIVSETRLYELVMCMYKISI